MRDVFTRAYRIGILGPVGCGKTTFINNICKELINRYSLAVITNDIYTREDADFILQQGTLPRERVRAIETGSYPHMAIKEDISMNLEAIADLENNIVDLEVIFIEGGGDNLAASFNKDLVDMSIFMIDAGSGCNVVRKSGYGLVHSDVLIINKRDLTQYTGVSLQALERDARSIRNDKPVFSTNMYHKIGLTEVVNYIEPILQDKNHRKRLADTNTFHYEQSLALNDLLLP